MPDFCTCGAELPPDAKFCHKCGKPQFEYPHIDEHLPVQAPVLPPPLPGASPAPAEISFHNKTAVRISFMVAVLAIVFILPGPQFLPVPRLIGGFFLAGFVAALWYERRTGQRLSMRSGARIGWITGVFSFAMFVAMFTAIMIGVATEGGLAEVYKNHKNQMPPPDPTVQQTLDKLLSDPTAMVMFILLVLVFFFVVFTTLPMLGGAVGAKLSEKRA